MLPLRFPWLWLVVGWAMLVAVCVGSLVPGNEMPRFAVSDKLLHAGSYFFLMVWFAGLYERRRQALIAVLLIGLGAVLDIAQQGVSGRGFQLLDIAANGAGILVALGLSLWILAGWCQRIERYLFA